MSTRLYVVLRPWVFSSWPTRFCYAARGHIYDLFISCKNRTI